MHDIITIGTATRDVFLTSPLIKIYRDPEHFKKMGFPTGRATCFAFGGKIEVDPPVFTTGGGATNTAVTFTRQGFKTATVLKLGNDVSSREIANELYKEGIQVISFRHKTKGAGYSTILLAPNGERTILTYRGAGDDLGEDEKMPFEKLKSKWVYFVPGAIDYDVINNLVNHFAKNGVAIAMNPSKYYLNLGIERLKPILDKVNIFIVNREEASYLTDIDYKNEKRIFKKLDELIKGIAVMTEGKKGVLVSDGKNIYKAGIFTEQKTVDRTGAGDAFGSGFVAGLIKREKRKEKREKFTKIKREKRKEKREKFTKEEIKYAIRLGSANATSVVEYIGAKKGILTRSEFEKSKRWQQFPVQIIGI
jgi:sugar/nucleoside kinase (ribokinase family)